jgi:pyruvate,orthophosphate dikinase
VSVILVRSETSPEDIVGMKAARGTLTARGGMTSHAAVVARGIGKPCVAGVRAIAVNCDAQTMEIGVYDEVGRLTVQATLKKGDVVTIDGGSGQVFAGAVPTVSAALSGEFGELLAWADSARTIRVRANADTAPDCRSARNFGAEGIGLCRTEHMFFDGARIQSKILADDGHGRRTALAELLPIHRQEFARIFREMAGLPVTIRLLDTALHERPQDGSSDDRSAEGGVVNRDPRGAVKRDALMEIHAMQVRAIFEAAVQVAGEGMQVYPEIMMPLAIGEAELVKTRAVVDALAEELIDHPAVSVPFSFGAAIRLPHAPRLTGELALAADFLSFDTGSSSRPSDPEVGALIETAAAHGRRARPTLKVGLCGEHADDATSVAFVRNVGLDYVSCDPYRLPVARLVAAQAALRSR